MNRASLPLTEKRVRALHASCKTMAAMERCCNIGHAQLHQLLKQYGLSPLANDRPITQQSKCRQNEALNRKELAEQRLAEHVEEVFEENGVKVTRYCQAWADGIYPPKTVGSK